MAVARCPDCTHMNEDCHTCGGSRYVHRNSWGRITRPATPEEFFNSLPKNVVPLRKPTRFPR